MHQSYDALNRCHDQRGFGKTAPASWPPNWRPGFQNPEDLRGVVKISSLRKKMQMCESDFSRAGGSAFRHVASSRPSFKCPPAALPGAFVDFSQKSREISALATSQRGVIFELSPS
jgi:hypothetical protein